MTPEAALDRLPALAGAEIIAPLHRGPAGHCYRLRRADDQLVLRIDTPLAKRLGLDRAAEFEILHAVSQENLGPAPVAADPTAGLLVTRFIPGRSWSSDDIQDGKNLRLLAALLKKLHGIRPVGPHLSLRAAVTNYAQEIGGGEAAELAGEAETLIRRLVDAEAAACLCHNDVIPSNVIEGRRLWLIDWEYAAIGDPFFELAVLVEHNALDEAGTEVLLHAYLGEVTADHHRRLQRNRALYARVLLLWLMLVANECGLSAEQEAQRVRIRGVIDAEPLP